MAATTDNWSQINPVLLYGGIALAVVVVVVAVAAYAMKRAKISLRPAIVPSPFLSGVSRTFSIAAAPFLFALSYQHHIIIKVRY